jgi:(4-O-methyl)-D-glucuronate---lignin esterase
VIVSALLLLCCTVPAVGSDSLEAQFRAPPESAKPRVWWHWMDGNISEAGIAADLQWMSRVGIGGVHLADVGLNTPQWVEERKPFMSPGWKQAFSYSVNLAEDEGLEFGVFSSPGWSVTGGPWVKPEQAMKKLVWSETRVAGDRTFKGTLPSLPIATGPFQNIAKTFKGEIVAGGVPPSLPEYHRDTIVIAYREPSAVQAMPVPKVEANFDLDDAGVLIDDDPESGLTLPQAAGKQPLRITMDYGQPVAVRSVTVAARPAGTIVNLGISEDGRKFRHLKTFFLGGVGQATIDIEPVTARYFRFSFPVRPVSADFFARTAAPGASTEGVDELLAPKAAIKPPVVVHSLLLRQAARVNEFERKAGFGVAKNYYTIDTPPVPQNLSVPMHEVIDLTQLMQEDGYLEWQAPPGNWVVLRMGYSLTGNVNHAASSAGTGLEVDKLNRRYVEQYMDAYLQSYEAILGPALMGKRGLNALMTDSFEVGLQNWTDDILEQFERLRGYDPRPWLPTLTGIVVESAEQSDKFLWDFRKTIADLTRDSHYKVIAEAAQAKGLTVYGEALESQRYFLGDDMDFRRFTDIPTAAMWMFSPETGPLPGLVADILGAASVAHVFGKDLVAAESLTTALAPWVSAPRDMKPVIDLEFALGINRPIIHSSVHQPRDDQKPGLSLSIFGQYLNRHDTWADSAKAWTDYLSRSAYLLQQGRFQADIAYFYGEETPVSVLFSDALPTAIPRGYGYDFVNGDAILTQLSVEDGYIVTPSGMRYRLLYLGGTSERMTLPVLKKLQALVAAGGVVVGAKPVSSPSLADDEAEFQRIAADMWGAGEEQSGTSNTYGDGLVFVGTDIDVALTQLQIARDFEYPATDPDTNIVFNHRVLPGADLYFVSNQSDRATSVEAIFRVSGKRAELWHADDGSIEDVSFRAVSDRTAVPLNLAPFESVFVVFREDTRLDSQQIMQPEAAVVANLDRDWQLSFTPDGKPLTRIENLATGSWSDHPNEDLKYFSGTATYAREFDVPGDWLDAEASIVLELGDVRELAEVVVNSQSLGTLWKPPYRVDVTEALREGPNVLTLKVTNLWVNQLIGDQRPGHEGTSATGMPTYLPNASLRPSGLIGPVRIERLSAPTQ